MKRLYVRIMTYDMYNTGHKMQCIVDSRYYNLCRKFNETADSLSKLDPECPSYRFELS